MITSFPDMTAAVCLKCGKMKVGAWTPCRACRHWPESPEDKARHLLATDHYLDGDSLKNLSQQVASGVNIQFPEDTVRELAESLPASVRDPAAMARIERIQKIGCTLVVLTIAGLIYLVWRLKQ